MNKMNVFSRRVLATPTSSNSPALACVHARTHARPLRAQDNNCTTSGQMKKMKKTNWHFLDHISLVSPLPDCYLPWVRARTHACTRLACTGQACGASTSVQSKYNTTAVKAPLELENEILELDLKYFLPYMATNILKAINACGSCFSVSKNLWKKFVNRDKKFRDKSA